MSDPHLDFNATPVEAHRDNNSHWLQRSLSAVWHPCTQMQHHPRLPLIPISRAEGAWLYDFNEYRYLDAISSWWVNIVGHAHPTLTSAIHRQVDQLCHVMLAGFTHAPVVELSERLAQLAPKGLGHCFYASDGASATEIALKMSLHAWQQQGYPEKQHFAFLERSYHGETAGALSVTDIPLFRQHYKHLLREHHTLASPDPRPYDSQAQQLDPEGEIAQHAAQVALEKAERFMETHHQQLAAIIVEPLVQGATGMLMYHSDYLRGLRRLSHQYGIHLIADEIMTGFGRTGTLFACEQADIQPDFLCLSKGITGGTLPLSVVMTTQPIYDIFYDPDIKKGFLHSHSYTGNPIACAAACAVLDIFEHEHLIENNQLLSQNIAQRAQQLFMLPKSSSIRHLRQRGMILAFEVDNVSKNWAEHAFQIGLQHHALIRPIGNTLYCMPPYCLKEEELDTLFFAISQILTHAS